MELTLRKIDLAICVTPPQNRCFYSQRAVAIRKILRFLELLNFKYCKNPDMKYFEIVFDISGSKGKWVSLN